MSTTTDKQQTEVELKRAQLIKAATANMAKLDDELLRTIIAFTDHAVIDEKRELAMTVTSDQGVQLFNTKMTSKSGDTLNNENLITPLAGEPFVAQDSILQFRMSNLARANQDDAEQSAFLSKLDARLTEHAYKVAEIDHMVVIQQINLALLKTAQVLIAADSYTNISVRQQYTTPNVSTAVFPEADFETVATSADMLAAHHMNSPSVVIVVASTANFMTAHARAVNNAVASQSDRINMDTIYSAAQDFAEQLATWKFPDIKRQCDRARIFVVAPLEVAMPLARDPQQKAEALALYNVTVRQLLHEKVHNKIELAFEILFIEGTWWLSPDQVNLRTHQLPLLVVRIQERIRQGFMADLPPVIDSPQAATTLYYLGHWAYLRIAHSTMTTDEKIVAMRLLTQSENRTVRDFPYNRRCKALDDYQLPTQCTALTAHNKGMQDAADELELPTPPTIAETRPSFTIPAKHVQPRGAFAQALQALAIRLYQALPETAFTLIMNSSAAQIIADTMVPPHDNTPFEEIYNAATHWIVFDHQVASRTMEARAKTSKATSQATATPVCDTHFADITLRDMVMLTILFPENFSEGPDTFWKNTLDITSDEWITYFSFLDLKTIKYIAHGNTRLSTIKEKKKASRQRLLAWMRDVVRQAGGGICQAQLEYETGLHLTHLESAVTCETLTVILGRQSHSPMAMPAAYREGDRNIFYFITHLTGTSFSHRGTGISTVHRHARRTWQNGRDDSCNAETETQKAIGPMTLMYGSLEKAAEIARKSYTTSKVKSRTQSLPRRAVIPSTTMTRTINNDTQSTGTDIEDSENEGSRRVATTTAGVLQTSTSTQPIAQAQEPRRKRGRQPRPEPDTPQQSTQPDSPIRKRSHVQESTTPAPQQLADTASTTSEEMSMDVESVSTTDDDTLAVMDVPVTVQPPQPTLQITTTRARPDQRVSEIVEMFNPLTSTTPITLGEGEFGPYVTGNETDVAAARAKMWRELMENASQDDDDQEEETLAETIDTRDVGDERVHTITMPEPKQLEFITGKHPWVVQTKRHMLRVLDKTGLLKEGTQEERRAHVASFVDKVRGSTLSRICLGCATTLHESVPVCVCRAIEGLTGYIHLRCFEDQTTALIRSIMQKPQSFSAQNEKVLTMMNTASWKRIFGAPMRFVGLDLEMWVCQVSLRNTDAINRITDLMEGNSSGKAFMNLPVCVEVGIAVAADGGVGARELFNKRYRIPTERTHAQLVHPAAHSLLKKILKLIDAMIFAKKSDEYEQQLRAERYKLISAWVTVKDYRHGKNYVKESNLKACYEYLDSGYLDTLWAEELRDNNDPTYGSLVKTKEDGTGLSIVQVEDRKSTCAFFARDEIIQKIEELPSSVICLFSGENDLDCVSTSLHSKHAIFDGTLCPQYRHVISNDEDFRTYGMDLAVNPSSLLDLRSIPNDNLFSSWVKIVKPSMDEIRVMEKGAHGAYNDAVMTYQLCEKLYEYRIRHGEVFDLLAPLDIDRDMYNKIMKCAFDRETGGPVGVKKRGEQGKKIRQHLKHNDFHATLCYHAREPNQNKGNRPASPVM